MKILVVADEESKYIWDFFNPEAFRGVEMILSCGDLDSRYLSFLATMIPAPVFYVHGNHDKSYERRPPEGCISIDGMVHQYKGVRLFGLGGCKSERRAPHEYTEDFMKRRVGKATRFLKKAGGFDILVTHAPARGYGDMETSFHQGFEVFTELIKVYRPKFHFYGHIHKRYGVDTSERTLGTTRIINAGGYKLIEI